MIGKLIFFAAITACYGKANPFGQSWDAQLNSLFSGQNLLPNGINFPGSTSIIDASPSNVFPSNILPSQGPIQSVPAPAPAPVTTQIFQLPRTQTVQVSQSPVRNIQPISGFQPASNVIPSQTIFDSRIQNVEPRIQTVPTVQTSRVPTTIFQSRFPAIETSLPPFPPLPTQIFQTAPNVLSSQFAPPC